MGALTFDALLQSLKQRAPDPVYYLHGEEDVLKDEAVRALLERAVDPTARDFNVDQRTIADLDPEAFNALVNTPPMLTATRAVVLRGMEQLRKTAKVRQELLRYVDSPNPTTVLVLVHGTAEPPDAELVRRAAAAARLVEPVLEQAGMNGVRMLSALGTALVGTALARAELDRDARRGGGPRSDRLEAVLLSHLRAARPYGLGSWEQTALRWARWAGLWSADELRHALRRALDADRAPKSSTLSDEAGILEQLVLPRGVRGREGA